MEKELQKVLAMRVRALREASPLSQEAMAAAAGLDRTYYARLERGEANPTWIALARIAAALDVHPSELLQGVEFDAQSVRAMPRRRVVGRAPAKAPAPKD